MNKKMRMFQALLIVAILLLQMIIPIVPSIAAGETITIECKDKNFYNAIKKELGDKVKSASDKDLKLTALKSDVESIDTLVLSQDYSAEDAIKIKDISGIENFKGLTGLDLSNNQISDIRELKGLTNLTFLLLSDNKIRDIGVLSGLTNLTYLNLNSNQISDISELSGLTNLTKLYLYNNQITKSILKTEDEVEFPQIFKAAKDQNSKIYTEEEYEFENCELTVDKTKVKLKEKGQNASVKIIGGNADGTTLNIVVTEEAQKTLESIKITTPPTKTVYTEGEKFNPEGMKVNATYSDETTEEVTDYIYTPTKELTTGDTTITVSYTENEITKLATQAITVKAEDPNTEKTIQCKDKNFYNAIKEKLGEKVKSASDKDLKLTALKSDVESINRLYLSQENGTADSAKITDISGIENFKGVNRLFLSNNQISNISALSELTNLTDLGLSNNKISDISALSGLANLTSLYLENNQISEINALSGLTKLTKLELSNNKINNISTLSNITSLKSLNLNSNEINDIKYLSDLTDLTNLHLANNKINDISALSGLTNLTNLDLSNNQISEISALSGLTNLEYLHLANNKINDISALSGLTNLTNLYLYNNQIIEISELSGLTNLEYLDLSNNQIIEISALSGLTNLTNLYLSNNQIIEISALSGLTNLTNLYLYKNQISEISALSGLTNLTSLYLYSNQITKNILKTEDEVELPQIFKAAKDPNSKIYTEEEYKFKNCVLTADKTKVKLEEKGQNAEIIICGGNANGTNLNIVVTEEAKKTLESIKITTPPTKTAYTEGEKFNPEGMKVTATYSDETTKEVTDYTYTPAGELKTTDTAITVSYKEGEKTVEATQAITVKAEDPNTEKTIQFKDENLYKAIKETLKEKVISFSDKDFKVTALKSDVESIDILNLKQDDNAEDTIKITDISGIENFKGLTKLYSSNNQISDIRALSSLTNLTELYSSNNQISDIRALSSLTNLTELYLSNNQISDISALSGLTNLTNLYLYNNQITKNILKTEDEVELPQIFKAAKEQNSKVYTEEEYEFENCELTADKTKVKLKEKGKNASVKIIGGNADGTTLNIVAVDEIPKELTCIEIASYSGKIIYTEGEDFDTSTLKIEAKYSDNSSKELKEGEYEIVDGKNLKVGQSSVTIRYTEGEKTVETTHTIAVKAKEPEVEKTLSKIEITTPPTKTAYTEGEKFDKTGMKVTATYSDGTTKEVTDYTYTPAGELKTTDTAITVSYKEEEKTVEAKYTITVKAKPPVAQKTLESIKVTTAPTKTAYTEGEKFDKTGMKVIATYSDGTTKEIKNYAYTPAGALKTTDKTITVSYTENGVTKTATQEITVVAKGNSGDEPGGETEKAKLDSIEIKEAPTKTAYTEGEKFDKTGMKVIATYSDGTTKEIKNYAYTPAGELTKKDTTITVSYTENGVTKTATQEITVVAKGNSGDEPGGETEKAKLDSIEIKEAPTKTVYTEGEKFDKTGMKVIAKYSDGTTKEIKNYAYTPAGALKTTDKAITVSYTENGVTKTDTQKIKIQNKDDGTGAKDKFPDTGAQIPIISGIVLMFAVAVASVVKIKRLTGI